MLQLSFLPRKALSILEVGFGIIFFTTFNFTLVDVFFSLMNFSSLILKRNEIINAHRNPKLRSIFLMCVRELFLHETFRRRLENGREIDGGPEQMHF